MNKTLRSIGKSCWTIAKLVLPIYVVVDVLNYAGVLGYISRLFAPITGLIGLPAEAALALAGGGLFNLYTGLALASPLGLSAQQWTIIGVFLGLFHSIIIEAAVLKKLSVPVWVTVSLRFGAAVVCSFLVSRFWQGSDVVLAREAVTLATYSSFGDMLWHSVTNAVTVTLQIMVLIAAIIALFDFVKANRHFGRAVTSHSWFFNVVVGLLLGVTYGAGLLLNEETKDAQSTRSSALFLLLCHGIIEETLLFTMFGASAIPIVLSRLLTALAVAVPYFYLVEKNKTSTATLQEAV